MFAEEREGSQFLLVKVNVVTKGNVVTSMSKKTKKMFTLKLAGDVLYLLNYKASANYKKAADFFDLWKVRSRFLNSVAHSY